MSPPNGHPWRRYVRFSVRGLIVAVLVIGGWLGCVALSARIQRDTVAAIQRQGGWVNYNWQQRGDLQYDPLAEPWGPRWLVNHIGVDYFGHPVYVTFVMGKPDDTLMVPVASLRRIERLELRGPKVTDAGLVHVAAMSGLRLLNLVDTQVSDAGLVHLRRLTDLQSLSLKRTPVSGVGFVQLRGLTLPQLGISH
jgi:internalin A